MKHTAYFFMIFLTASLNSMELDPSSEASSHKFPWDSLPSHLQERIMQLVVTDASNEIYDWQLEQTLKGHKSSVLCLKYHPKGNQLSSGSDDRTIKLWDVATGAELRALHGHNSSVYCLAYHPKGNQLASGSDDRTIKLWDVATGAELRTLWYNRPVWSLAFHPEGGQLASVFSDGTIKLLDPATGARLRTLWHNRPVVSLAFHPEGNQVAYGSIDGSIKVWDLTTDTEMQTLHGHDRSVGCLEYHPEGSQFASGSDDKMIKLWGSLRQKVFAYLKRGKFGVRKKMRITGIGTTDEKEIDPLALYATAMSSNKKKE